MAASEQVPEHHEEGEGLALRLPDGSVYFFRDEILEACKVTEEGALKLVEGALDAADEVSGFGFDITGQSAELAHIKGLLNPARWKSSNTTGPAPEYSTTMCPW